MVSSFRGVPYSFRALAKTYGAMWVRCDVCRRYVRLKLAGLHDVDYRTKTFSCSRCGAAAYIAVAELNRAGFVGNCNQTTAVGR